MIHILQTFSIVLLTYQCSMKISITYLEYFTSYDILKYKNQFVCRYALFLQAQSHKLKFHLSLSLSDQGGNSLAFIHFRKCGAVHNLVLCIPRVLWTNRNYEDFSTVLLNFVVLDTYM